MTDEMVVTDARGRSRFELLVNGEVAGFAEYTRRGGRVLFLHTEIDPRFEGQGLGSQLARGALDLARRAGERVVPLCPFIASFIDRHPDYGDLVDHEALARLGEPS